MFVMDRERTDTLMDSSENISARKSFFTLQLQHLTCFKHVGTESNQNHFKTTCDTNSSVTSPELYKNSATATRKILTSHYSYEEVKLHHSVAEGGGNQSRPSQTATNYNDRSAAKSVDEDTADRTWTKRGDALINTVQNLN